MSADERIALQAREDKATFFPQFRLPVLTRIVERSFAWLGRNRRLSKGYEYNTGGQTSETLIEIAATRGSPIAVDLWVKMS